MVDVTPFLPWHVLSVAARAAELDRLGEEDQNPDALVRAARLYALAIRIADDIEHRVATPFTRHDLARVRDELRDLATDTAAAEPRAPADVAAEPRFRMTRAFREIVVRIEQRVMAGNGDGEPHADRRAGA